MDLFLSFFAMHSEHLFSFSCYPPSELESCAPSPTPPQAGLGDEIYFSCSVYHIIHFLLSNRLCVARGKGKAKEKREVIDGPTQKEPGRLRRLSSESPSIQDLFGRGLAAGAGSHPGSL